MKQSKTKYENNWRSKTLENLEKSYWGDPGETTYLISTCHRLRKKQLRDFETEDLRIMIGQNIGLKYLIPLALEVLKTNVLAEGHLYPGDLLKSVVTSDQDYWAQEPELLNKLIGLVEEDTSKILEEDKYIFSCYTDFKKTLGVS